MKKKQSNQTIIVAGLAGLAGALVGFVAGVTVSALTDLDETALDKAREHIPGIGK